MTGFLLRSALRHRAVLPCTAYGARWLPAVHRQAPAARNSANRCNPVLGHSKNRRLEGGFGCIRTGNGRGRSHRWLLAGCRPSRSNRRPRAPPPPDFSKVEIKTTDLGDNIYMLEGQGGNITVAVAKDGIIMVDGQFAPLHDKIKAAIAAISNQPIKYLDQHALPRRPHRRQRALRQGRRHRRRRRSTSRSGSRPGPPTA